MGSTPAAAVGAGPGSRGLVPVAVTDGAGTIVGWTDGGERLLGYRAEAIVNRPVSCLLASAAQGAGFENLGSARYWSGVLDLTHRHGNTVTAVVEAMSLAGPDGETGWLFSAQEVARAGGQPAADASLTNSLLEHAPVALALWDTSLRCVWLNSTAAEHADIAPNAGDGRPFKEAARNFRLHEVEPMMRRVLENGKPVIDYRLERVPGASGETCTFSVSMFRLDKADGTPLGVGTIGFDVSDSKAHQRLSLLSTAGKRIGTTLDVVTTAQELADIAVASFADYVTVDLADTVPFGTEPREHPGSADYGEPRFRRAGLASIHPGIPEAVFSRGETVFLPPSSPIVRPGMTGTSYFEPYLSLSPAWLTDDPARAAVVKKANMHSAMIVPLKARGIILGVAVFARTDNPAPFTSDDLLLAEELVARASLNLDDARQYARERAIALALQRDLLPQHLSGGSAVDIASTYLPTDQHAGVGGDWYDAIPLPEGRIALVVGDVVGHGIGAAATMGRVRTAVHTLTGLGLAPHEVIARLDSLAPHLSSAGDGRDDQGMTGLIATCIYARYDPVTRICSFARAGHPPPAIRAPDGKVTFPDVPTVGPIGLGLGQYASLDVQLAEGSVIAMFTDGLIETRADGIDAGLDRLGAVLAGTTGELDDICAHVIDSMRRETSPQDDVALLLARTRAAGPHPGTSPDPMSASPAQQGPS
jgi:serine phosphatase RsbU (regulator of sigma subunit)/PAS domain-containing protein